MFNGGNVINVVELDPSHEHLDNGTAQLFIEIWKLMCDCITLQFCATMESYGTVKEEERR